MKKQYRDFQNARKFVRKIKCSGRTQWVEYCKSGKKPEDIPNWPDAVYKNKGWTSWSDFLGTDYVATYLRKYKPIKEARKYAQRLNIKNQRDLLLSIQNSRKIQRTRQKSKIWKIKDS